ncbi:MAG: biliverdin-producing heme oxygenase [Pseudomonadota bacterium]
MAHHHHVEAQNQSPHRAKPAPVLESLRKRTTDVHNRLHGHPVLVDLTSNTLTSECYVRALRALERFHESVERALDPSETTFVFSPAIGRDLDALRAGANPLPACPALPRVTSDDEALGVGYVLEGSAMGGQLIARSVADTFGWPRDAAGLSHFRRDGVKAGRAWRDFLNRLQEECGDTERCTDAAVRTFQLLEDWLWQVHKMEQSAG